MKRIISNPRIQTLISILIIFASYIISSLQGVFGVWLPLALLGFSILEIILVYYIITIPTIELLKPPSDSGRVYSLDRLKEYELTSNIKEIWIITSSMNLAFDQNQFGPTIFANISKGVKYKFYINNNNIAITKERAIAMNNLYKSTGLFEIYLIPLDLPFVDQNTDYDLFFLSETTDIRGFIGITINNKREYVPMTQELAIKLKLYIERINLKMWDI